MQTMTLSLIPLFGVLALPITSEADSQVTYTEFRECGVLVEDTVRLACFDAILKGDVFTQEHVEAALESKFGQENLPPPTPPPVVSDLPSAVHAADEKEVQPPGVEPKPISNGEILVEVIKVVKGSSGLLLYLSNEQVWAQSDNRSLGPIRAPFTGTIKKASLGTYRFSPSNSNRAIQVKRRR